MNLQCVDRVAFFGGTGFLGSSFTNYLIQNKISLTLEVISRSSETSKNFVHRKCNVNHIDSLNNLPSYDIVIHGVSDSSRGPLMEPHEKINNQLISTINIAEFCRHRNVKRIIFLSSGAVYGVNSGSSEDDGQHLYQIQRDRTAYGISKLLCELYLQSFCDAHGIELRILRCFSFGGRNIPVPSHYALSQFTSSALNFKTIAITGSGLDLRTFMHQDDFSFVLLNAVCCERFPDILNVGSSIPITIKELANKIARLLNIDDEAVIIKDPRGQVYNYVPNVKRLMSTFPGRRWVSVDAIITDVIHAFGGSTKN